MLKIVKKDLNESMNKLREVQERWEGEQHIFTLLRQNLKNIEQIPADTLQMYSYAIGSLYYFNPETEAYDVLKGSIWEQYIKDKELMTEISRVYKRLNTLQTQLARYSEQKANYSYPILANLDIQETEQWISGNIYDFYRIPMQEKGYRTFLVIGKTILSDHFFDSCASDIQNVIQTMEKNGY